MSRTKLKMQEQIDGIITALESFGLEVYEDELSEGEETKYKNGKYKELPELVRHFRTDSVRILCDKPTAVNLDGELRTATEVRFSIAREKLRFFFPKELSFQKEPIRA